MTPPAPAVNSNEWYYPPIIGNNMDEEDSKACDDDTDWLTRVSIVVDSLKDFQS